MIQSLCVRDTTGATNGHLSVSDVSKFPIPLLPPKTIKNIEKHVINSFESRIKSKSLLEIAKRGVEIAIEQNEVSAEKWIREEVDKIGLKNS